jgi:hypothetical protein
MQSLVSIAAGIAAAGGLLQTAAPPIGTLRYGSLRYEIRAVHQGAGLGGLPAYCAEGDTDLVMVVYSVRNTNPADLPAQAVPRLALLTPEGSPVAYDQRTTEALAFKITPPITLRGGRLGARDVTILADVFVTRRGQIYDGEWHVRPGTAGAEALKLPLARPSQEPECAR